VGGVIEDFLGDGDMTSHGVDRDDAPLSRLACAKASSRSGWALLA
jgi:hypothetical protein